MISKEEVLARWENGPRWDIDCDDEAFNKYYVEPIEAFGLSVRHDHHPGIETWYDSEEALPPLQDINLQEITSSTQAEGVILSMLAKVIREGTDQAPDDPEGWFGNEHVLLLQREDGSYTIRDGNHRCIGGKLRGDKTIKAYVIEHNYKTLKERLDPTPEAVAMKTPQETPKPNKLKQALKGIFKKH